MKTIRRRAEHSEIGWESLGPDYQYKVTVRNEDTGQKWKVYEGYQTSCRLPGELRLTSDQLSFRVQARPVEGGGAYVHLHGFQSIRRLGDDLNTPAPDLLQADELPEGENYRLIIRDSQSNQKLVDTQSARPRFLLPPGQLRGVDTEWVILSADRSLKRSSGWRAVSPEMIAAADARAERLVELPATTRPRLTASDTRRRPGRVPAAPTDIRFGKQWMVAVSVTLNPALASSPTPESLVDEQWFDGKGGGLVERVAAQIENAGAAGVFFVDILAASIVGEEPLRSLAATLRSKGHAVELMINPTPWSGLPALRGLTLKRLVSGMIADYTEWLGSPPIAALLGPGSASEGLLAVCRAQGLRVVIVDGPEQRRLPAWMHWRTLPFAAVRDLVLAPATGILSTPAHSRDRVVRHALNSQDALSSGMAGAIADAFARTDAVDDHLVVARIDPLALLSTRISRSAAGCAKWNEHLRQQAPDWVEAGWTRSPEGFPITTGLNEIRVELAQGMISGLTQSDLSPARPERAFSAEGLAALAGRQTSFELLLEHRRGPRRMRHSAIRKYDNAYRLACLAPPK